MIRTYSGLPNGKTRTFVVPADFIAELMPLIDDLAELKVTLFAIYAIQQREGRFRYLRYADFADDEPLMRGLVAEDDDADPDERLDAALERAVMRGSLLRVHVTVEDEDEDLYFINTELGRTAVEQIEKGAWQPGSDHPIEIMPERPNIYRLYEANIGPLTPHIADRLKSAEQDYTAEWVEDAIRIAIERNVRNWNFIEAVLKRWEREGKRDEIAGRSSQEKRISGSLSDVIIQ